MSNTTKHTAGPWTSEHQPTIGRHVIDTPGGPGGR